MDAIMTRVLAAPLSVGMLLLAAGVAFADTYHVDCTAGSDAAAGTTTGTAWRTVAKVSATMFGPGDAVLFRRGTRCQGTLWPKGSGDAGRPIRIGSYGQGALPVIDGSTGPAALTLFNQQGWHVEHIETVGGNPHGIYIGGDAGTLRHFRIRDVIVRHVTGEPKTKYSGLVVVDGTPGAVMEDVVIDGVIAHHTTQWAGVIVVGPSREKRARDVTVRNTVVHDVFGDGIVLYQVEDGLIEKSAAVADRPAAQGNGGDFADPLLDGLLRPIAGSPVSGRGAGAATVDAAVAVPAPRPGRWTLKLFPDASREDARSQLVFLEVAMAQ